MRVTALQLPACWGQADQVLAAIEADLAAGPATDLVLLPEAALTGYLSPQLDFDLTPYAEPLDGPTASALAALAQRHQVALAGPLIERDGEHCYNALLMFDPEGRRVLHYRKRHPWYPETWASAGDRPAPLVEIAGRRITAMICFDIHFVAKEAQPQLEAAEVLLFPSAWVEEDGDSRPALLGGLAQRFQLAIVHANWGPGSPRIAGQGDSRILSRTGETLALASAHDRRIDAEV